MRSGALLGLALLGPTLIGGAALVSTNRAGAAPPTLEVTYVLPDSITVTLGDGTPVGGLSAPGTVIPPGTYDVYVEDDAQENGSPLFQITGPGVDLLDAIDSPQEYVETFQPNATYTYEDDGDSATTAGIFSTSAGPATSPAAPAAAATTAPTSGPPQTNADLLGSDGATADAPPVELGLALNAAGAPRLTSAGRGLPGTLAAGAYVVRDSAAVALRGFSLTRVNAPAPLLRRPAGAAAGTFRITLAAGSYRLVSGGAALRLRIAAAA